MTQSVQEVTQVPVEGLENFPAAQSTHVEPESRVPAAQTGVGSGVGWGVVGRGVGTGVGAQVGAFEPELP